MFVYGDIEKANNFFPRTGFLPRFVVHGCTRLAVKLDFIAGLLLKAVEASGTKDYRGVQANVGEVIAWRNLFWGLSDAMVRDPKPWIGNYLLPNMEPGNAYQIIATMAYSKVKYLIEQTVASGLIYLNSHAQDFQNEDIRPYLDRYLRGSNGYRAEERVKLMKLLWDTIGTEFGGRHELYEINYGGSTEEIRRYGLFGAQASGAAERFKGFAEQCMAEYDLKGWKVDDLLDPERSELARAPWRMRGRRARAAPSTRRCSAGRWDRSPAASPSSRRRKARACMAMTANAFMSGSMTPPLCLVSVGKHAHTHPLIAAAQKFGVTVLAEHQESIARRFAGQPIDGADVGFVELARVPVLSEGVARIATTLHAAVDCGDHTLYIGEILDVIVEDHPPLLYHRSVFRAFRER